MTNSIGIRERGYPYSWENLPRSFAPKTLSRKERRRREIYKSLTNTQGIVVGWSRVDAMLVAEEL